MTRIENPICRSCLQNDSCGMRSNPMSPEQINYVNGDQIKDGPPRFTNCFFYTCETGEREALEAHDGLKRGKLSTVFGSYDKPPQLEARKHGITGRFVNIQGDIFVQKSGETIYLRNLFVISPKMQRKRNLLDRIQEAVAELDR